MCLRPSEYVWNEVPPGNVTNSDPVCVGVFNSGPDGCKVERSLHFTGSWHCNPKAQQPAQHSVRKKEEERKRKCS